VKPAGHPYLWTGPRNGDVLLLGWGGTFGAIKAATLELEAQGIRASACHLRYLNPLPSDLGGILKRFTHVIVPELNMGQLRMLIRAKYLVDAKGINKVRGQPFTISELVRACRAIYEGRTELQEFEAVAPDVSTGG
jgi:2-oxoglutarate ferredoxin oxidoreductase subunit alpha